MITVPNQSEPPPDTTTGSKLSPASATASGQETHTETMIANPPTAPSSIHFTFDEQSKLEKRKVLIRQTWRAVEMGLDVEAIHAFYNMLFGRFPEIRPMFKSTDMNALARKLYEVLQVAVRFLDNLEDIIPILQDLGVRHARCYGVSRQHYDAVTESFIAVLNEFVLEKMPSGFAAHIWMIDIADAWSWIFSVIGNVMADAADEAIARQNRQQQQQSQQPQDQQSDTKRKEYTPAVERNRVSSSMEK